MLLFLVLLFNSTPLFDCLKYEKQFSDSSLSHSLSLLHHAIDEFKMHIYIISRSYYRDLKDTNVEENTQAIETMKLLQLKEDEHYTIINAIEGIRLTEDDIDIYVDNNIVSPNYFTSNGHSKMKKNKYWNVFNGEKNRLGLQLSYLKTMSTFLLSESRFSLALVLEEDATLGMNVNDASQLLTKVLHLPLNLDVFYLGWCYECNESKTIQKWYTEALYPLCRHSILWTRTAAQWYMDVVKPLRYPFRGGDQLLAHYLCAYSITKRRLTKDPIFVQNLTTRHSTLQNHDKKDLFFPSDWTCDRWKSMCNNAKVMYNKYNKTE